VAELHDLTALEQGELVRRGEASPLELVEHYLERADRLDSVGAFVTLTPELARERAAALGAPGPDDSPLFGVPTAIKDLNLTAGVRTTFGSAAFTDFVPDVSDGVTLSLEAAGMVSLGKTNTPEFGSPCYTEPDVAPPAVTPWDRTRMASGGRVLRRSGRGRRRRAGARRPGLGRRRLDPDPGLLLWPRRPEAHARPDQRSPTVRRPGGSGDGRVDRPDRARRGGDARRARRS
jgi:hypothetical protein